MRLQKLDISNFSSFGEEQSIDFRPYGEEPVLIIGENRDEPGANSNGSGKSSIMHAISWAIFGKLPTKVPVDEVVRFGADHGSVTIELEDSRPLMINRYRDAQKKKARGLSWTDGDLSLSWSTPTEAQEGLIRRLGFQPKTAFTDFLSSAYFSMEAMTAFTSRSGKPEERMALISRFLGLDVLDTARDIAREAKSGVKGRVEALQEQLEALRATIATTDIVRLTRAVAKTEQTLQELKDQQEVKSQELEQASERDRLQIRLKHFTDQLDGLDDRWEREQRDLVRQVESQSEQIGTLVTQMEKYQAFEKSLEDEEYYTEDEIDETLDEINDSMARVQKMGTEKSTQLRMKRIIVDQLEKQFSDAQHCPNCDAPLSVIDGVVGTLNEAELQEAIENEAAEAERLEAEVKKITETQKTLTQTKEVCLKERTRTRQINRKLQEKHELAARLFRENASIDDKKKLLASAEERKEEEKKELEAQITELNTQLGDYEGVPEHAYLTAELRTLNVSIEQITRRVTEERQQKEAFQQAVEQEAELRTRYDLLRQGFESADFWSSGFPTIRRWRVDHFLPEFEGKVNQFLEFMDVGTRVRLSTMRRKRKTRGDEDPMRAQFTIQVTDSHGTERDIETYSMGESRRIGLAVGFALRELTLEKGTNRFDFILLDEVVDSLDAAGTESFFRLLPKIHGCKLVISHDQSLVSRFDHVIRVIKEDGVSTVQLN